jgi:GTP cyclohydrolase I
LKSASDRIRSRLDAAGVRYYANDCIAGHIEPGELDQLERELSERVLGVLDALVIDTRNDHNTRDTANRIARMYVRELFKGRYTEPPAATSFPNAMKLDELYVVGPIAVRSCCAHHLCPVEGSAWCGVIPSERVIGLSKFSRLADWVLSRPQTQEEAVMQLADLLESVMGRPQGLAVVIKARHSCMTWRGVREANTMMTTSVMRGIFQHGLAARAEFFSIVNNGGGK